MSTSMTSDGALRWISGSFDGLDGDCETAPGLSEGRPFSADRFGVLTFSLRVSLDLLSRLAFFCSAQSAIFSDP